MFLGCLAVPPQVVLTWEVGVTEFARAYVTPAVFLYLPPCCLALTASGCAAFSGPGLNECFPG